MAMILQVSRKDLLRSDFTDIPTLDDESFDLLGELTALAQKLQNENPDMLIFCKR